MTVSHRGRRLCGVARNGAGAWWDNDGRLGITRYNLALDAVLIVSTLGGERRDWAIHLIEQGPNLRGIIDIAGGQRRRRDLPSVGVYGDVQLAPRPPGLPAMLLISHSQEPQSFTVEQLRQALIEFPAAYNATWLLERHGFRPPAAIRAQQLPTAALAA